MAAFQQVANSFVTEFFERLAKNSADLVDLYGRHSVVTINDFELGVTESQDAEARTTAQQWALVLQGSQLRVETVNAAPLYGGVNVFVTFTAVSKLQQQYFQIISTLESYSSGFAVEGYYIRHQVISRIGAIAVEPPAPSAEPAAVPVAEAKPIEVASAAEPSIEKSKQTAVAKSTKSEAAAISTPVESAEAADVQKAGKTEAAESSPTKPKSWATLASSAPVKTAEQKPIRVVAYSGPKREESSPVAVKRAISPTAATKEAPRRERRVAEPIGDRLMFNIEFPVSDDEIRTALGVMATSIVSLRNNSETGHVFMDFAQHAKAFDELKSLMLTNGEAKTSISVFRQRAR